MPSASTLVGSGGPSGGGAQRVGQAAVHEQGRVDAVSEVAQLLHRFLEVEADLIEHRLWLARDRCRRLLGEANADRECDEVLLRAVMEVAFDRRRSVSSLDDAGTGSTQLVRLAAHRVE